LISRSLHTAVTHMHCSGFIVFNVLDTAMRRRSICRRRTKSIVVLYCRPIVLYYISAYMSMFSALGKYNRDEGNDISRTDFAEGYGIYCFGLTVDLSENESFNLARRGTVRIDMKFGTALPYTVTVVAYAEFENIIEIDRNRNVVFDFNN